MKVLRIAVLALATSLVNTGEAADDTEERRFVPYEPSYGMLQIAEKDDNAIRGNYSFKYSITSTRGHGRFCEEDDEACGVIFLSYTGQFDFYLGTRSSSPVINRISNPAIHYRMHRKGSLFRWIDVALEHRSNGQSTEITTSSDAARAQQAFDQGDHVFFDGISRSTNYLSTEVKGDIWQNTKYYAKLKLYISDDNDITWGPLAGSDRSVSDYDRLRLVVAQPIGDGELSIAWTVGDLGLKTDSWDVSYLFSKTTAWTVAVRYHYGPMQTLSNYTEPRQSLGVGINFYPFAPK